eukprot:CAMPEP_0113330392 /NCGR_PEP_ID=MMETSP0010_2-20120614/21599_1 /TAXON_ID=216773 ORGANISM="Corethron hystrix, Strain 308" /NCGR_SAMPLE_ID=MMETSP0010_2 /ASSEMBLY_ACC=CAM_ASM_000155 /LENGTH=78 /DNA_ID=CAMNT_0000192925 /DNA_START=50 /DNA_END=286 /DNA_ORIENTATION=- /assembly_acc=CAM_ASM_000155
MRAKHSLVESPYSAAVAMANPSGLGCMGSPTFQFRTSSWKDPSPNGMEILIDRQLEDLGKVRGHVSGPTPATTFSLNI